MATEKITVQMTVKSPIQKVWDLWTAPSHITKWNAASEDWHTPKAENDVRDGGKFKINMAAKDGSSKFDFEGIYTKVKAPNQLEYTIADGRRVQVKFEEDPQGQGTRITETFEAEQENPLEQQQQGWQNILNNFKKYAEKSQG